MTNKPSIARPLFLLAAAIATASAVQAQADTRVVGLETRVQMVPYDKSELASQDGVRGLYSRVRHAAHQVCARAPSEFAVDSNTRERRCFSRTLSNAFAQVDQAVASWQNNSDMAMAENIVVTKR